MKVARLDLKSGTEVFRLWLLARLSHYGVLPHGLRGLDPSEWTESQLRQAIQAYEQRRILGRVH